MRSSMQCAGLVKRHLGLADIATSQPGNCQDVLGFGRSIERFQTVILDFDRSTLLQSLC